MLLHGMNLPEGQLKILHKNKKGQASEKGKKTALTSLYTSPIPGINKYAEIIKLLNSMESKFFKKHVKVSIIVAGLLKTE